MLVTMRLEWLCELHTSAGFLADMQVQRKLVIACILCFIFMTVEVIGGYIAKRCAPAHSMHTLQHGIAINCQLLRCGQVHTLSSSNSSATAIKHPCMLLCRAVLCLQRGHHV